MKKTPFRNVIDLHLDAPQTRLTAGFASTPVEANMAEIEVTFEKSRSVKKQRRHRWSV